LKEVEGCFVTRLAEMTGMSESTVKVRLFHTRRKLVDWLLDRREVPCKRARVAGL
jgi:DNA-directed RNA polymerase specialized sigma24 family protein